MNAKPAIHASDMLDDWQYPRFVERFRRLRARGLPRYSSLVYAFFAEGCGGAARAFDYAASRELVVNLRSAQSDASEGGAAALSSTDPQGGAK